VTLCYVLINERVSRSHTPSLSLLNRFKSNVKDHPLVSRFQGSDVLSYKSSEFDEFLMALGPITAADAYTKSQRLEGKVTKFKYSQVPGRSGLEVIRRSSRG
jgi:hypothetical protein